jgi:1,4-dihydroxy-2-naphthoate octaprenyltransferase
VFVMLFFGFVAVCGTVFVQAGEVPLLAWLAAIPVGAIATAVLVVNNLRDRELDAKAGKRTLAVRLGERATVLEYTLLLNAAEIVPFALSVNRLMHPWAFLLPAATYPWAAWLVRQIASRRGRDLNPMLKATALLLLAHSALFAAGLAAGAFASR